MASILASVTIWLVGLGGLLFCSARALARTPRGQRLAMQWAPASDGAWKPTWTAPRGMAVAFLPVVALAFGLLLVGLELWVGMISLWWMHLIVVAGFGVIHASHLHFAVEGALAEAKEQA